MASNGLSDLPEPNDRMTGDHAFSRQYDAIEALRRVRQQSYHATYLDIVALMRRVEARLARQQDQLFFAWCH